MPLYFSNSGHIELDVIRTMGVSVKETNNPIGFFGTGLKYAIATLLRTGHIISLRTNGETIQFRTKPKEIRGQKFNMIYMDDEQLGFTTDLGKNWQVWQAYRELYSNCLDEGGVISSTLVENDTVFTVMPGRVFGPNEVSIMDVHAQRNKIFLHGDPWIITEGLEIHRGKSSYIFYRGVRVHELLKPTRFTYNLTCPMKLTEDRTLASVWDMHFKLSARIPRVADPEFCNKVVDPSGDWYEQDLDYTDSYEQSDEFLDALEKYREHAQLKQSSKNLLKSKRQVTDHVTFVLTPEQEKTVREACDMLRLLNCYVRPEELTFVEHLGPGVLAQAADGQMRITRQCIANGRDFTAITIYEEWIHDKMGYKDETRGMQQFLFDKILELLRREIR